MTTWPWRTPRSATTRSANAFTSAPGAPQHRDLQTPFLIDMHVQDGLREVAVRVELLGQSLRQFTRGMIIDVTDRRDAVAVPGSSGACAFEAARR